MISISNYIVEAANTNCKLAAEKLLEWGLHPLPCSPSSLPDKPKAPASKGIPILHKEYQQRQPTQQEIDKWFSVPDDGIGVLGGTRGLYWIDFDIEKSDKNGKLSGKGFENRHACKVFVDKFFEQFPELREGWVDISPSGGVHIAVRLKCEPGFTNFAHKDHSEYIHLGELLGEGLYTVVYPTEGYENISFPNSFEDIPEFDSIEELGFISTKTEKKVVPIRSSVELPTDGGESYEISKLVSKKVSNILSGQAESSDRSKELTIVINEVYGWSNWLISKGYQHSESPLDLSITCGQSLGLDSEKIQRILDTVNTVSCLPGVYYFNGDDSCEAKLRNKLRSLNEVQTTVEQTIFEDLFGGDSEEYITIASSFYRYTGKGYYELIEEEVVKKMIADRLTLFFMWKKVKKDKEDVFIKQFNFAKETNKQNSFKYCQTLLTINPKSIKTYYRCFADCTVDMLSGNIYSHSKDHYLTTKIDYPYKKSSDCPPIFHSFIEQSYGLDLLPLIRAAGSMLIDPTAPFGKFISLTGDSGSGKGTLLRIFVKLSGEESSTSLPDFGILNNPDKCFQYLAGRSLVTSPDLQGFQEKLGNFYELVDNGFISGRPLNSNTTYNKQWFTRFVAAYVGTANLENAGLGWDRRNIPIPTLKRTNTTDYRLAEKLDSELGDILSWILAIDKTERDELLFGNTKFQQIEKQKFAQAKTSNPVVGFIDSCLSPGKKTNIISNDDIYQMYKAYCKHSGYMAKNQNGFSQKLIAELPQCRVEGKVIKEGGKSKRNPPYWIGICQESFTRDELRNEWVCTKTSEGYYDMFKNPDKYKEEIAEENKYKELTEVEKNNQKIRTIWDSEGEEQAKKYFLKFSDYERDNLLDAYPSSSAPYKKWKTEKTTDGF